MLKMNVETPVPTLSDKVQDLLDSGRTTEALLMLTRRNDRSPDSINARGVCLMRLGRAEEAALLLRPLVFLKDSFCADPDARPEYITNFATALLLTGNISGAREAMRLLGETETPARTRLRDAIARWRKSLGILSRLGLLLGVVPNTPVTLNFPAGDL